MGPGQPNESRQDLTKDPNFSARIEADLTKFGAHGINIRNEYRGMFYCCIGFSLYENARNYVLDHPQNAFVAISKDQLAQHATRYGLIDTALADQVLDDDLMMWWSRLYLKT